MPCVPGGGLGPSSEEVEKLGVCISNCQGQSWGLHGFLTMTEGGLGVQVCEVYTKSLWSIWNSTSKSCMFVPGLLQRQAERAHWCILGTHRAGRLGTVAS